MLPSLRGPQLRGQRASAASFGGTDRSGSYLGRGLAHSSLSLAQYYAASVERRAAAQGLEVFAPRQARGKLISAVERQLRGGRRAVI
jgi:hypothetical protein